MAQKIRIGVIGCGRIANSAHLPSYSSNPECKLVYVCDIIEEKAQRAAAKFGAEKAVTDYREVIDDPTIDAVSVCTPNNVHSLISIEALRAGKQVLCEKPAARTLDEALMMQKVQSETGGILNIGVVNRFNDNVNKIKELIDAGELGEVYHAYASFRSHRSIPGIGGAFTDKSISGGGVLIDWGVHFIDIVMYCLGEPKPKSVSGETFCKLGKNIKDYTYTSMWAEDTANKEGVYDVDDSITALIRTEGAAITLHGAWAQNVASEEMFIDFMGTKGGIRLWYGGGFKFFSTAHGMLSSTDFSQKQTSHFQNEIDAFINDIKTGNTNSRANININIETSKIMEAIYTSAAEHREVVL